MTNKFSLLLSTARMIPSPKQGVTCKSSMFIELYATLISCEGLLGHTTVTFLSMIQEWAVMPTIDELIAANNSLGANPGELLLTQILILLNGA